MAQPFVDHQLMTIAASIPFSELFLVFLSHCHDHRALALGFFLRLPLSLSRHCHSCCLTLLVGGHGSDCCQLLILHEGLQTGGVIAG